MASRLTMEGRTEESVLAYREMLDRYPDDYWARNNLRNALKQLGKTLDSAFETYRLSELRPADLRAQVEALSEALMNNDMAQAHTIATRARAIVEARPDAFAMEGRMHLRYLPLHELWVSGRLEELGGKLDMSAPASFGDVAPRSRFMRRSES